MRLSTMSMDAQRTSDHAARQVYIHDFFTTKSSIIFVLHPCTFSSLSFLSGFNSITESLSFDASQGTILAV